MHTRRVRSRKEFIDHAFDHRELFSQPGMRTCCCACSASRTPAQERYNISNAHKYHAANHHWCRVRRLELAGRQDATGDLVRSFARRLVDVHVISLGLAVSGHLSCRDTAGQERYATLAPMYYRCAPAGFVDTSLSACLVPWINCGTLIPECDVSCLREYFHRLQEISVV